MKNIKILFVCFILQFFCIFSSIYAQKLKTDDVPDDIVQSFDMEYSGSKIQSWILEGTTYIANFKDEDGYVGKAYFSNDGTWIKTLFPVPFNECPLLLANYVTENYPNYEVSVCCLQQLPKMNTHYYLEVRFPEVGSKDEPSVLTFNHKGELMKRTDPEGWQLRTDLPAQTAPVAKERQPKETVNNGATSKNAATTDNKMPRGARSQKNVTTTYDPWAQYAVDEKAVPELVKKTLKKKAVKPIDNHWFLVGETYISKCKVKELPMQVYISNKGIWKKSHVYIAPESVNSTMVKHLETYYKGYKYNFVFKEMRADKQDKVYIEIYEKKNWKKKIPTGLWFDGKTRKFIKAVDPNFEDPFSDPDLASAPAPTSDRTNILSTLPDGIKAYVSSNYPPYHIRKYQMVNDDDLGEIYQVEIANAGDSYILLYFDKSNQFLRKEMSDGKQAVKSDDDSEIRVPESIISAFKKQYPRVEKATWEEEDYGHYSVTFLGTKGEEKCYIDPKGEIYEIVYTLDKNKVLPEIENYIKENYGRGTITDYFSVKKMKDHYYKVYFTPAKSNETHIYWFEPNGEFDKEE